VFSAAAGCCAVGLVRLFELGKVSNCGFEGLRVCCKNGCSNNWNLVHCTILLLEYCIIACFICFPVIVHTLRFVQI
jgi:hypothetical protein